MRKKLLGVVFVMTIVLCCSFAAFAAGGNNSDVKVSINDNVLSMDVPPYIEDGRTLIPIRAISENLKYDVSWDANERRVDIVNGNDKLSLYIGKQQYTKNGEQRQLDVPAKIRDGRTMVPLRLISEEFGCDVSWDPTARMASIIKYNVVEANTPYQLVSAIGDYTKIILPQESYNLSELDDLVIFNPNISRDSDYGDTEYSIVDVKHLIIEAESHALVTTENPFANVLVFENCEDVQINRISARHEAEKGICSGGVFKFIETDGVSIYDCILAGCGTYGLISQYSNNIRVVDTNILDCTYGLVDLVCSNNVDFIECPMTGSVGDSMINLYQCKNINFRDCLIKGNKINPESLDICSMVYLDESTSAVFENCKFEDNVYKNFFDRSTCEMIDCVVIP